VIEGDKSYTLRYVDWEHPENNVFHVTDEFTLERSASTQTRRPDVVVFVNGIPLAVIECQRPDLKEAIKEAISPHLRNHAPSEIPVFFCLTQLLLAVSQNAGKYGTTRTDPNFGANGARKTQRFLGHSRRWSTCRSARRCKRNCSRRTILGSKRKRSAFGIPGRAP
jgi:type I site-specific restriction-modification system R (restriction) subunit